MSAGADNIEIQRGPRPGLLGDVAALHGRYYAAHWDFPTAFETKVAREMAAFLDRYDAARDLALAVDGGDARVGASITLDVSDPDLLAGEGHVRWFIIGDSLRGRGLGKALMAEVLAFARTTELTSIYLTTFRGLDAAAKLYRDAGFIVTDERAGTTWGRTVIEQRLELRL
ncbi:MAG: N-acetyltransferase family protein [Hyphomicrobiaceae bacterium]